MNDPYDVMKGVLLAEQELAEDVLKGYITEAEGLLRRQLCYEKALLVNASFPQTTYRDVVNYDLRMRLADVKRSSAELELRQKKVVNSPKRRKTNASKSIWRKKHT